MSFTWQLKNVGSFSVIIPLYNKERFINRSLNSLVQQTQLPDEIIIIDDRSTDNSFSIVSAFPFPAGINVIIRQNKENQGPAYNRNLGVAIASSDYVAFLDADDCYATDLIASVNEAIKNVAEANIVLLLCQYIPGMDIYPKYFSGKDLGEVSSLTYRDSDGYIPFVGGGNAVIRKKFITDNGISFDTTEKNYEDWLFYFTALAVNKEHFILVNKSLYLYYNDDGDSLSRKREAFNNIKIPRVVSFLEEGKMVQTQKLVVSIWLSSSFIKIGNRIGFLRFIFLHFSFIARNFVLNKFTFYVFLRFILPVNFAVYLKNMYKRRRNKW